MGSNDSKVVIKIKQEGFVGSLIRLAILATVIYFVYRAFTSWIPYIYDVYENFLIGYISNKWWLFLIIFIVFYTGVYFVKNYKDHIIDGLHGLLRAIVRLLFVILLGVSFISSTLFLSYISFNVMGLGTFRHVTNVASTKGLDQIQIKSGVNGKWAIGVMKKMYVENKTKEQELVEAQNKKQTLYTNISEKISSFIESEIDKAPAFIKITTQILLLLILFVIIVGIMAILLLSPLFFVAFTTKLLTMTCRAAVDRFAVS